MAWLEEQLRSLGLSDGPAATGLVQGSLCLGQFSLDNNWCVAGQTKMLQIMQTTVACQELGLQWFVVVWFAVACDCVVRGGGQQSCKRTYASSCGLLFSIVSTLSVAIAEHAAVHPSHCAYSTSTEAL